MKYIKIFLLILCAVFIITSCDNSNNQAKLSESINSQYIKADFKAESNKFIYAVEDMFLFNVDENGLLYYITQDKQTFENVVNILDLNGSFVASHILSNTGIIFAMVVSNNIMYYMPVGYEASDSAIYSYDLKSKENKAICIIKNYTEITKLAIIGNKLYFIGIDADKATTYYDVYDYSDEFVYKGEVIKSLDLVSGELIDVYTELPLAFSETADGNIMIYAYDKAGGYYFTEYNTTIQKAGGKIYNNNIKMLTFFEAVSDKQIIYSKNQSLNASGIGQNETTTELINNLSALPYRTMIYKSGYLFYKLDKGINRVLMSELFRDTMPINMIYTDMWEFPENYGFKINKQEISYDEYALYVLSGDTSYDLYIVNSRHRMADNLRSKGAFYPLSGIPEAVEYINACFPYIKEAAMDKNNDIWMIPYKVRTISFSYNENLWSKYNLEINSVKTLSDLVDLLKQVADNNINETYSLNSFVVCEQYFYQLLHKNGGFNRDDFKAMAEYCYNNLNYLKSDVIAHQTTSTENESMHCPFFETNYGIDSEFMKEVIKNEDFDDIDTALDALYSGKTSSFCSLNNKHYRSKTLLTINEYEMNPITCEFFCVNPNSKNLDTTLYYISEFCKRKLNTKNTFTLKDRSMYDDRVLIQDHYDMFSNGYISFGMSNEIFIDDFEKFLRDEIMLDEYLNNIEFKLNAYLKE